MKPHIGFDHRKATQALNFFARKEKGKIDLLKVIKLIWLADRYHLRRYGRTITNDAYVALRLGPVGSFVKDIAQDFTLLDNDEKKYKAKYLTYEPKSCTITSIKEPDSAVFSDSDLEAFEAVYSHFGKYTGSKLVELSHHFPEWKKFEAELTTKVKKREFMDYIDFFENPGKIPKTTNVFNETAEVLELSKQLFKENEKMEALFR